MITENQVKEIKKHLNSSENPLFFFDDDTDGLTSYLLLKRHLKRGKGIVLKNSPYLSNIYLRKIEEYSPDKIFVLDKPLMQQEVVDKINIPIIWIDHHIPIKIHGVHYYNPRLKNPLDNSPVSYWCYKITKKDMWISSIGVIGDWHIPPFFNKLIKNYPSLLKKTKNPGELLYETEFGTLIRIYSFLLKGKTSDVRKSISILEKINSPYEILNQETAQAKYLYKKYEKTNKEYQTILNSALNTKTKEKLLVFTYPSIKTSFTGELANELMYKFPKKVILIAREKSGDMRFSLRSTNIVINKIIQKALEGLTGYGGGHEYACGGSIKKKDFPIFISNLKKLIK